MNLSYFLEPFYLDIREIGTFLAPECCYVDLVVFEVFQVKSLNIKGGESVVVPVQREVILHFPNIFNRYLLTVDIFNPFVAYWWLFI